MEERIVKGNSSRGSVMRLARRQVTALSLAGLVLLMATAGALAVTGAITQPAGTAGCVSDTGSGPCADGHALFAPHDVAVSPDGKSVYAVSFESGRFESGELRPGNAVARLKRNTTTGAITQPAGAAGCISKDGTGACADGHALRGPSAVAVSPDGKSVYVASYNSNAVARFNLSLIHI